MQSIFKNYWQRLPDLDWSHILLRIPLALVFITQALSKMPFDAGGGAAFGVPALVWWFVVYGEFAAGVGLLWGGLTTLPRIKDIHAVAVLGDMLTRFSHCNVLYCYRCDMDCDQTRKSVGFYRV